MGRAHVVPVTWSLPSRGGMATVCSPSRDKKHCSTLASATLCPQFRSRMYSFVTPASEYASLPPALLERIVESFARDGVLFLREVLSPEIVEAARLAAEEATDNRGGFVEGGSLKGLGS
jgi:hypothetical protein